jgi:hypothetical protein
VDNLWISGGNVVEKMEGMYRFGACLGDEHRIFRCYTGVTDRLSTGDELTEGVFGVEGAESVCWAGDVRE